MVTPGLAEINIAPLRENRTLKPYIRRPGLYHLGGGGGGNQPLL